MENKIYDVTVSTPLGNKNGTVNLTVNEDALDGTLTLLNNTQPLSGVVSANGDCELKGTIVTIARTLAFTAVGHIGETDLSLLLRGGRSIFRMRGTLRT